jgi:pyruvate/2-oxoglutarate dehydrogenase complex dihydrolipoamide dehydrogenase (E3) component
MPGQWWYKATGAELIMGAGNFVAPKTLEVRLNDGGTRAPADDQVFINIGTHATIPSVPGLDAAGPLTNIELLELDYVPRPAPFIKGSTRFPTYPMVPSSGSISPEIW